MSPQDQAAPGPPAVGSEDPHFVRHIVCKHRAMLDLSGRAPRAPPPQNTLTWVATKVQQGSSFHQLTRKV